MNEGYDVPTSESVEDIEVTGPVPVLAVVGRPNVGKSTLVNRIIGRREAVVEDVPGVTRDRVSYDANWNGRAFTVVDTGGWDPDARGLAERIAAQAEIAVGLADAVLFVVDATVGITDADEAVVKILRKSEKPVILAANKVDDQRTEAESYGLWNLGLGEPFPVSALHGRGSGDMLDAILAALPEPPPERIGEVGGPRRIAIVGKPNVGKSSLLNRLAKEERAVVDNVAGTTVDPVDELIELGDRTWRFIDTAGIRKRVKEASGHEYYASLRTSTAIDRAEVAVLVVDGGQSISEQDVRILQTVREAGRALVIAFNKWDLVDEDRRYYLDREIERELVQVQWAPRINITARTGWHVDRLVPALDKALDGWETRIGDRRAERVPRPPGRRAPAPGARRQAAEDHVRHPALDGAADVHPVHQRQAGRGVRTVHRAPAARGVRLRREPDRHPAATPGEAQALTWADASLRLGCRLPPDRVPPRRRRSRPRRGRTPDGSRAKPVSGTTCATFPADNWWRADVSDLPRHRRSRQWLSHMSTRNNLHPDFGPSYGDGPNYGIPITVVGGRHRKVRVRFGYASESDKVRYPLGRDTRIEGGRRSDGDRHAIIVDRSNCKLYETFATRHGRRAVARRVRRRVEPAQQRPAPERLDLRRRRRPADPARPAALERGAGPPGQPRDPVHHRHHLDAPPLAGPARRRLADAPGPTRRWVRGSG